MSERPKRRAGKRPIVDWRTAERRDGFYIGTDQPHTDELGLPLLPWGGWMLDGQLPSAGMAFFIQHEDGGPIKIGEADDVEGRVRDLNLNAHDPRYRLLATMDGGRAAERDMHVRFRHLRVHSNWFLPEPELLELIADLEPASVEPADFEPASLTPETPPRRRPRPTPPPRLPKPTDLLTASDIAEQYGMAPVTASTLHANIARAGHVVSFRGYRRFFVRRVELDRRLGEVPASAVGKSRRERAPRSGDFLTASDVAEVFGWTTARAQSLMRSVEADGALLRRPEDIRRIFVRWDDIADRMIEGAGS